MRTDGSELFYSHTARANSGEDRTEISVKSSFQLNLPPHLIVPSSSIKLDETIGQGNFSLVPSLCHFRYVTHHLYASISGEFGIVYKGYIKKGDSHSVEEYLAIKTLKGIFTGIAFFVGDFYIFIMHTTS